MLEVGELQNFFATNTFSLTTNITHQELLWERELTKQEKSHMLFEPKRKRPLKNHLYYLQNPARQEENRGVFLSTVYSHPRLDFGGVPVRFLSKSHQLRELSTVSFHSYHYRQDLCHLDGV